MSKENMVININNGSINTNTNSMSNKDKEYPLNLSVLKQDISQKSVVSIGDKKDIYSCTFNHENQSINSD